MGILDLPVVDKVLELIDQFLEENKSKRELLMTLIEKTNDQTLIDDLIRQYLADRKIDLENKTWWQERFRALGDIFDGDAWKRLADLFQEAGVDIGPLPKKPTA